MPRVFSLLHSQEVRNRNRHHMGNYNATDLKVVDQPHRFMIVEDRSVDVHPSRAKQIPSQSERIRESANRILTIDNESWQIVGKVITERDRND